MTNTVAEISTGQHRQADEERAHGELLAALTKAIDHADRLGCDSFLNELLDFKLRVVRGLGMERER